MKSRSALLTILTVFTILTIPSTRASFGDLPENHYYSKAFNYLQTKGIIKGYIDNTARPGNLINRAELMKMLIEGFKMSVIVPETPCFSDIQISDWFTPYICTAKERGIITGLPDGNFEPVRSVNKAEALKMLAKMTNLNAKGFQSQFSDVEPGVWFAPFVIAAEEGNYLEENGTEFHPTDAYTRGQVAEILYRILITLELRLDRFEEQGPSPVMTQEETNILRWQIFAFDHINQIRWKHGVGPLKLNPLLNTIAVIHSRDMGIFIKAMSHKGSLGEDAYERELSGKVPDLTTHVFTTVPFPENIDRAGENVGKQNLKDFDGAEQAIKSQHEYFLDEPVNEINHRTIMLSTIILFTEVGIGLYLDKDENLWITEDYISLKQ